MEARNITIINSRTQNRVVISSTAETLAELKADCRDNNIDYEGLAFFEGISKSELNDDNAILPKDLPWKGTRTNDLIFMLTEPQKKIKNGAVVSDRMSAYTYIKANGLQAEVQKRLGDNFTRCKTLDLIDFCNKYAKKTVSKTGLIKRAEATAHKVVRRGFRAKDIVEDLIKTPCDSKDTKPQSNMSLTMLIDLLIRKGVITEEEAVAGEIKPHQTAEFTDSDIDSMFRGIE